MMRFSQSTWTAICLICSFGALASPLSAPADAVDDYVKARMERDHIPGACFAVIYPDGREEVRSYGLANLETETPFTRKSVFRIASLSKQFCAYAAISLVQRGKLQMVDPVTKFFPGLPEKWQAITIKDLLGHRSGIGDPEGFAFTGNYTPAQYLKMLGEAPLMENPGETYRYNNHGYSVLGLIVGQLEEGGLPGAVKRQIFDPLGMTTARYYRADEVIPHRADAYRWSESEKRYTNQMPLRPLVFHGSGGILMSMDDMLAYERGLRKQDKLDKNVLARQWMPVFSAESGYGGGWNVGNANGQKTLRHTGGTWGFTSLFTRNLTTGITFIMFRTSDSEGEGNWEADILKRLAEKE